MAQIYNKEDLFNQAKKVIVEHNLFFFSDVTAMLPCHHTTFYEYFKPDGEEHTELKEMLEANKIRTKSSIRAKLFKSSKAAELLALYRLICTPEEHRLLNQQYVENKFDGSSGMTINFVDNSNNK